MAIIWRPQMSVGNTHLDADHRYLLCLINTVELSLRSSEFEDLLEVALEQLAEYTHEHFNREEKLQLKIQYPQYADHKMEHQELIETLEELSSHLKRLNKVSRESVAKVAETEAERYLEVNEADLKAVSDEERNCPTEDVKGEGPAADEREKDVDELIELLRHWIMDHVLQTDMKMKSFLEKYPANYS